MPHLHDMEELISSIEDNQVKDYMKEAMSCYMANAYRACIVLTYLALFDDIVKKLGELGKVNKKAKKIHDEAQNKMNEQDVYENFLIEQLSSNSLLPTLDTNFLDIIRQLRNKSAHPSGHSASAEEARFVFYESINRFLSKPILTTTQLVDNILARLDDKYFFPSTNITKTSAIVKREISNLHNETYPYLINKLLDKYLSSSPQVKTNAAFFLTGLAYLKNNESSSSIIKYVIDSKCSDSKCSNLILRLISANGSLLLNLETTTYDRLRSVISERIKNVDISYKDSKFSHPSKVLSSILQACGEDFMLAKFKSPLIELFQKNIFSISFIVHMNSHPEIVKIYLKEACKKAGSFTYDEANYFSRNIYDVDEHLSSFLSGRQAFLIIAHISKAADNGANEAKSLRVSNFSSIPELKEAAIEYIKSNKKAAQSNYQKITGNEDGFDILVKNFLLNNLEI
ncbi:hypothetical protein SC65A3_00284 [Psychrobacter sp. SC65A.3]|uniref:hypothetical protein n=1 Tax=Psychrobacter sp. SC65A.3 TaxID=2983299 RepID=UPI0021D81C01|nr:hypothetical protein [Psychrobacter sp. SC65A.3]WAI86835.1 hypothetical protein SC65A3_00284 [Psychrobacter sp. SC65A.3]